MSKGLVVQGGGCTTPTFGLRFEVCFLRVLDAFWPRGATWLGQVISSPPGPSGGPSKTHLLPGGGVPRVHRARSPVPPRLPRFAMNARACTGCSYFFKFCPDQT